MTSGRWGSYAKASDGVFVSKDEWASAGVTFFVHKISERGSSGGFGPQWELDVQSDDAEETILTFSQGAEGRDDALRAAQTDLASGAITEMGPLVIVKRRTKSGNTFYAIEDAPEGDPEAPSQPATSVPVSVPTPGEMP